MSTYLIGDVHGCFKELKILLEKVQFNPTEDTLWLTGDLVARGPNSLEVLRFIHDFKSNRIRIVLGNHDLHLLASYVGIKDFQEDNTETLLSIKKEKDADELINWLRHQPILQIDEEKRLFMVHAGIAPQWNFDTVKQCAKEIESALRGDDYALFLAAMYSDNNRFHWSQDLNNLARLQFSINAFTRIRYCFPDGTIDMSCKDSPKNISRILQPWFMLLKSEFYEHYSVVFGHWSSLSGFKTPKRIYGLDTGCCWGNKLTLLHWEKKALVHVPSSLRQSL
ncbi:bis(5'-nucleosyl)-tetraphosphatase (symmetrical) ApaH [Sodalis sp. CWE]|uniref:bis(5'-nucleosyl)-tetraphosphatase (symmetrical) ApaH n=1 Tax=Sodalis sp. CWE TaxID=2803816 RepID=UPI001C7D1B4F|nr:bis(5'-nucleosyl)-tetraphosphatase (symmetrical) ApaH [Sodalis sp. CWE]MBX4180727.1 bis(5'-nucleosyl)-tetraphosphatase (symmetrical) ApaH [Sodalis sp. CWE]